MGAQDYEATGPHRPEATRIPNSQLGAFSELIGSIYDCALDPSKWESVLWEICRTFEFGSSILSVIRFTASTAAIQVAVGVEPEWLARVPGYQQDVIDAWGGMERVQQYPLDEPVILSRAVSAARIRANRYFREWASPQGIVDAIAVAIARTPIMLGNVAFSRPETAAPLGDDEVEGLRLLAPHIRRAVTISDLFDMQAVETAAFGSVLDSFAFGIVLVDKGLGIVHANRAAQAMLVARDPIRSDKGILTLPVPASEDALARAVRQAASDEAGLGGMGIGIPLRSEADGPSVIHVLPLRQTGMRRDLARRAAAALFVAPSAAPARMPADALALLYDLTPAETRIFEMIAAGRTQAEIAATLGIAPSTVKSHLLHLFAKTGCRRQADLLRLAASLSLPV